MTSPTPSMRWRSLAASCSSSATHTFLAGHRTGYRHPGTPLPSKGERAERANQCDRTPRSRGSRRRRRPVNVWPGQPYPLGATYDGTGTNFAVYSFVAEAVELCLFDDDGGETRVELPDSTAHCFHGFVPNVSPGQRYGFRVYGPYEP